MRTPAPAITVAVTLALLVAPGLASAQGMITVSPPKPAEAQAERPVTYSAAQVATGRAAYDRHCVMCHGAALDDGEFGGPPLNGNRFQETFGEQPVSVLYSFIEAAMPPDGPQRVSPRERTDIVAYLLSRNGYPQGAELPVNIDAMDNLIIEK